MTFTSTSGTITQTETDADLSGLSGVAGVTVVNNGSHKTYHLDGKQLRINGTLTIDPQVECILLENQNLHIYGTLNFGVTAFIGGATRYSRAIGLISHDNHYLKFLVQNGGTLNWNGGAMKLQGGCDFKDGSTVSIKNGIIISTSTNSERIRMNTANCSVDGLSVDGNLRFDVFKTFVSFRGYESGFTPFGAFQKVASIGGGTNDPYVLTDFDAQGIDSANGSFIGDAYRGAKVEFVNMGYSGDFVVSHHQSSTAVTTLYKDVKLKIVDTDVLNIAGAKYWATDKDNGSRFGTASWLGSQNEDEPFSSDRVYTGSTDSNGEATERLLTRACYGGLSSSGIYNGNTTIDYRGETTDNTDVFTFYVASYQHTLNSTSPSCLGTGVLEQQVVLFADVFLTESNKAIVDVYSAIDTPQKFYDKAKAYLVDNYAGEADTLVSRDGNTIDAGSYNVVVDADAGSVFAISGNTLTIKATTFVGNITTTGTTTLSNDAVVVGTFGTTTVLPWQIKNIEATSRLQLYNVTKEAEVITQKLTGIAYNKTTLLELMGPTYAVTLRYGGAFIDATSIEVIASGNASSSWTLQNGVVQFNVGSGVLASALIQDDTDIKVDLLQGHENNTVTATATISSDDFNDEGFTNVNGNVDTEGTYTSSEIAVGDVVRLRVTCVVGANAMLPLEVVGVASSTGLSFSIDQQEDIVYDTNAVDGSTISTWTADFTNTPMGVDLSESDGGATVQEIYAFIVYSQTTATGVDKWFNVVRAIDGSNYQIDQAIADIKIQNIGDVAVNISGGRIFRKDGASVLYAVDGDKPLTLDTGALVANIQPQLESALNNNAKISSTNNNSNLIPALL